MPVCARSLLHASPPKGQSVPPSHPDGSTQQRCLPSRPPTHHAPPPFHSTPPASARGSPQAPPSPPTFPVLRTPQLPRTTVRHPVKGTWQRPKALRRASGPLHSVASTALVLWRLPSRARGNATNTRLPVRHLPRAGTRASLERQAPLTRASSPTLCRGSGTDAAARRTTLVSAPQLRGLHPVAIAA